MITIQIREGKIQLQKEKYEKFQKRMKWEIRNAKIFEHKNWKRANGDIRIGVAISTAVN